MGKRINGVGSSAQRTPGKHSLLRKTSGRETGVCFNNNWTYVQVDLTAGDGRNDIHSGTSSPEILMRNRDWLRSGGGSSVVGLIEKRAETFRALRSNFPDADELINGDARDALEITSLWSRKGKCAVFIHNDPNSVHDFALSPSLVESLPPLTTTMSSLGCNVGGLKMMDLQQRLEWYRHVELVVEAMRPWHDAMLVSLDRDEAQWAYLLTGPKKWRDRYIKDAVKAFSPTWPKGLRLAWYSDKAMFDKEVDRLFLTKEENCL